MQENLKPYASRCRCNSKVVLRGFGFNIPPSGPPPFTWYSSYLAGAAANTQDYERARKQFDLLEPADLLTWRRRREKV